MRQVYGYIRVSTKEQNEQRQLIALDKAGISADRVFMDKQSGKDFARPQYQYLVHGLLKQGDLLVVKSIDRLGRNYQEILEEWRFITKELRADIHILDMPLLNTELDKDLVGVLISDIVLQLLSFVSENERINIRQRQAEGIAAAKKRGVHMGRPPEPIPSKFEEIYQQWRRGEINHAQAEKLLCISKSAFYRLVQKYEQRYRSQEGASRLLAPAKEKMRA